MFVMHVLVAFLVALVLSGVFVSLLGWRRPGDERAEAEGAGTGLFFFFLILFVATWAGGLWLAPFGPMVWDTHWAPFLLVGVLMALVLAALVPTGEERWRWRRPGSGAQAGQVAGAVAQEREADRIATGFGLFFWILLLTLGCLVFLGYFV